MSLAKPIFWACAAGIVHTHVTYPLSLAVLRRLHEPSPDPPASTRSPVTLIVAAHDESDVIAAKVTASLALDYPRELLQVVVASDGSSDGTAELAREAGADLVLDLPRGGKLAAQDAAAAQASGEILAFSDANTVWEPEALAKLVAAFADPEVAYACGQVRFLDPEGDNEEGLYWRYEMAIREAESDLGGITAGNGGIYAVRASDYRPLPPSRSHDLSLPFMLAREGRRSVYVPDAVAAEKPVPSIEGEFARKRRMMRGIPDIVVGDRMYELGSYPPAFAYQLASHRLLRYLTPLLHAGALLASLLLAGRARVYALALAAQLGFLLAAAAPPCGSRLAALARYYVLTTASIGLGCLDRLRDGPPSTWERAEGTR